MNESAGRPSMNFAESRGSQILAEASSHWITTVDSEWRILSANRAAADLIGVASTEEMHGRCILDWLTSQDRERAHVAMQDLVAGRSVEPIECYLVLPNGTRVTVELSVSILRSGPHEPGDYVVVARYVTESRRRANTHGLEALGQMASGVAHDLNQTLALITGYVELARQEIGRDAAVDTRLLGEHLDIAWKAALDGGHLVKRLLAFARAHEKTATECVNVAGLLEEIARLSAPRWRDVAQAEGRPIVLSVQADAQAYVLGDAASLRQALVNLVFNAVDALPCGGNITLTGHQDHQQVVIRVSDTGTGMTPEVRRRIFDPFFTTKGERGTGLGLPQVDAIVQQHGGELSVESECGVGTTFRINLRSVQPSTVCPDALRVDESTSSRLRVLIVEDEPKLAIMASMLLARDNHDVRIVSCAEEALAHLGRDVVDVVLSDLGLGTGMSGWDLADQVRRRWPSTRMLLATGWGAAIDPQEARSRGIDLVLAKPYRASELRSAVRSVIATGANTIRAVRPGTESLLP